MNRTPAAVPQLLLTIALLACAPPASASGGGDAIRETIERLEHDLNAAVLTRDRVALERFFADDYTTGGVQVLAKAEQIDRIVSALPPKARTIDEMSVRLYGDTAVVTGLTTVEWLSPEGAGKETSRWVNVWVRGERGWRVVHGESILVMTDAGC